MLRLIVQTPRVIVNHFVFVFFGSITWLSNTFQVSAPSLANKRNVLCMDIMTPIYAITLRYSMLENQEQCISDHLVTVQAGRIDFRASVSISRCFPVNQDSVLSNCVLIHNCFGSVLKEFFTESNICLPHVHLCFLSVRVTPTGQASAMIVALCLQIICFVPLAQPQAYISVISSHIVGNEYFGESLIYSYAV